MMGRAQTLTLFGVVVFVGALAWTAPLAVLAGAANLSGRGISYDRAQGTIWSGDLLGVRVAGQPVGRVTLDLQRVALLRGRLDYAVEVAGPAGQGRGELVLAVGGGLVVRDLVADVNLQAIERLDARLREVPSTLSLTVPELVAGRRLACERVDGRLRTDLLQRLGGRLNWQGPAMAGIVSCDGEGGYRLSLANVDGPDEITLETRGSPVTASVSTKARVRTDNQTVADTLTLLKFQKEGDAFIYSRADGIGRPMGEAG